MAIVAAMIAVLILHHHDGRVSAAQDGDTANVRALTKSLCSRCHNSKTTKGDLDLERFSTVRKMRADIETWEQVLVRIERNEMPPETAKQPTPAERKRLIDGLRKLIDDEALRRDGDPGPALVRRLNNAEYDYTIRDLTGVELRASKAFPADGAAGEGFLNATDALTISPEQMSKYLDAAKDIAAHAVMLPDGFRFSPSKFREDWSLEVLQQIVELYERYSNEFGQLPFDQYLAVLLANRQSLQADPARFPSVVEKTGLSPKYVQVLWSMLNAQEPSMFLQEIRDQWQTAKTSDDATALANRVSKLQALLWHKRDAIGLHTLDDRYVPPGIVLAKTHTFKLGVPTEAKQGMITLYLATQPFGHDRPTTTVILKNARFEMSGKPTVTLYEALKQSNLTPQVDDKERPLLIASHFGSENDPTIAADSLILRGSKTWTVRLPATLVAGRSFIVDVTAHSGRAFVHFDARLTPEPPSIKRGVEWTDVAGKFERYFLTVDVTPDARHQLHTAAAQFREVFPGRVCYPGVVVRDTVVTLERYHRGDRFLSQLLLNDAEQQRLDRLWEELHFISRDALAVRASYATLIQGEFTGYKEVSKVIHQRAAETEKALADVEPKLIKAILGFAARAYRRPLSNAEQRTLSMFYQHLRDIKLTQDESLQGTLARVLVSPSFLYRLESTPPGKAPQPVDEWELASRLSFFLWSTGPDEELRALAENGQLRQPGMLKKQIHRMLQDSRSRRLAVEFGTQWLEVRNFRDFDGKNEELFPTFNAELRAAMYEESVLTFQHLFQSDSSIWQLLDANHTFSNGTLAKHYGLKDAEGAEFRRVVGVRDHGRGGILGLGSVLSKHSSASRTSPVLRGNWIAEILLGEELPLPPDGVPELPETESIDGLSVRQLVEQHAKLPRCASCHQRIDPLGFALEEFDTIGRRREQDAAKRPIDANARLKDGTTFRGIDGLRRYLMTERRDDFRRQLCRKLLGYALGRRVLLSDRQLLMKMDSALQQSDGRVSAAIETIVQSPQFQLVRGADFPGY